MFLATGAFPVYPIARRVDGCNFSNHTVWEGNINTQEYCFQGLTLGRQYIAEATEISSVVEQKDYDFVLSSHCLEHVANPIKALKAWTDLLAPDGIMFICLPHNQGGNIDYYRSYTSYEHLLNDYLVQTPEQDLTHADEIIALHNYRKEKSCDRETFRKRSLDNFHNRCLHHHLFSIDTLSRMFTLCSLDVLYTLRTPADLVIIGRKK